ncbi:MAG: LysR family transcriptional regulator [Oscillospiraceae bacterium]|nr:LysR family transcriptional regulator [Massiliimalia sp.]MCI6025782.1 LysR family transcriptional regulator [Oscillospiraceae bacterium]MDY3219515.1 LysR family transcriptional regulator [Candidatus Fimivivens sp.]SFI75553.1 DNA-binding transcriptional regulator, LysR family [Ruminococcaceae bacterium D5]
MELRELRYFVQIARDHSYTRAAEHLYVSQPALSKMMKKLEGELQVPLLDVRSGGVYLTDYGETLYEKTVPLLNEFDALQNFAKDVRCVKNGKLRVGVTPMLGTLYLVDIMVNFCNQYPGVELKLVENGSKEIRRQLMEGNIDIGLCISGDENEYTENTVLFQDEMIVCVHASSPLARHASLEISELKNEPLNFYSSASTLFTQIKERCIQAGFEPKINISSTKVNMLMQMTSRGVGSCILPRPYAKKYLLPNLKMIPIEGGFPWVGCLVKNKSVYQPYVSHLFEQYVMEYFQYRQRNIEGD